MPDVVIGEPVTLKPVGALRPTDVTPEFSTEPYTHAEPFQMIVCPALPGCVASPAVLMLASGSFRSPPPPPPPEPWPRADIYCSVQKPNIALMLLISPSTSFGTISTSGSPSVSAGP